jgi:hypothetical protein
MEIFLIIIVVIVVFLLLRTYRIRYRGNIYWWKTPNLDKRERKSWKIIRVEKDGFLWWTFQIQWFSGRYFSGFWWRIIIEFEWKEYVSQWFMPWITMSWFLMVWWVAVNKKIFDLEKIAHPWDSIDIYFNPSNEKYFVDLKDIYEESMKK